MVEDDPATREALHQLLAQRGWRVTVAASLRGAIVALAQPPRWVVLDLMLPDGDGVELLEVLQPQRTVTSVVVVTAVTDPDHLDRARAFEPKALLHKPADWQQLLAVLEA